MAKRMEDGREPIPSMPMNFTTRAFYVSLLALICMVLLAEGSRADDFDTPHQMDTDVRIKRKVETMPDIHCVFFEPGGDEFPPKIIADAWRCDSLSITVTANYENWQLAVGMNLPTEFEQALDPSTVFCKLIDESGAVIDSAYLHAGQAILMGPQKAGVLHLTLCIEAQARKLQTSKKIPNSEQQAEKIPVIVSLQGL